MRWKFFNAFLIFFHDTKPFFENSRPPLDKTPREPLKLFRIYSRGYESRRVSHRNKSGRFLRNRSGRDSRGRDSRWDLSNNYDWLGCFLSRTPGFVTSVTTVSKAITNLKIDINLASEINKTIGLTKDFWILCPLWQIKKLSEDSSGEAVVWNSGKTGNVVWGRGKGEVSAGKVGKPVGTAVVNGPKPCVVCWSGKMSLKSIVVTWAVVNKFPKIKG